MSLSPEERVKKAREAWADVCERHGANVFSPFGIGKHDEIYAAEIHSAILDDRMTRTADDLYKLSYESGRKAGIEEAAKVAYDESRNWSGAATAACERLAVTIRALSREREKRG